MIKHPRMKPSSAPPVRPARLFAASWMALIVLAMTFAIRTDILAELGVAFDISHARQGLMFTAVSVGYLISVMVVAPLCDRVGMRRWMAIGCAGHAVGIALMIGSPRFGYGALLAASFVIGLADGAVEAVMNPLIARLYPNQATGRINALHAAWPAGLIMGGGLCLLLPGWPWQAKLATILVPVAAYGWLIAGQRFPPPSPAHRRRGFESPGALLLRPGVLLLLGCMALTAATEVGPDVWVASVMTETTGIRGITYLMFMSVIMLVMRLSGVALVRAFGSFGLMAGSCVLAAAGLWWMGAAFTPGTAFAAATVFAIGKTCLWPTLLGVAAERYPRGGPVLLAALGATGMLAGGAAGPLLGRVYDHATVIRLPAAVAQRVIVDGRLSPAAVESVPDGPERVAIRDASRHGAAATFRAAALLPIPPLIVYLGFMCVPWFRRRR